MRRHAGVLPALLASLSLAATGCGAGSEPPVEAAAEPPAHRIDWDVSEGHELDRIDWDAVVGDDQDIVILTGGVDLRLELPGGEVVDDRFKRVMLERDETHLLTVDGVFDRDLTVAEAYDFNRGVADRFEFDGGTFDEWLEEMSEQEAAGEFISTTASAGGPPLSREGPSPSTRTIRSGSDERPINLTLTFSWRPDGEEFAEFADDAS